MGENPNLTGKNLTIAQNMLKDVTTILEKQNVWYCLDCGTLLGIVRENRLLPWDKDMDICVTEQELPQLLPLVWRFRGRGYWARVRRVKRNVPPLKRGDVRVVRVRNRKYHLFAGPVKLDIFIKYSVGDEFHWVEGFTGREITKSTPKEHFSRIILTEFNGKKYWIPEAFDEYLTCHYGDWRTPQEQWDHLTEDRAIIHQSKSEAGKTTGI